MTNGRIALKGEYYKGNKTMKTINKRLIIKHLSLKSIRISYE